MPRTELRPARRLAPPPLNPLPPALSGSPEALAQYWLEKLQAMELADLTNLIELLDKQPSRERTIVQNIALARARKEQARLGKQKSRPAALAPATLVPVVSVPKSIVLPQPVVVLVQPLFTEQEQADIRRLYPTAPWPDLLLLATGRTRQQIMSWAINRGLKRTKEAKATAQSVATKGKPKRATGARHKAAPIAHSGSQATPVLNARVASRTKSAAPSPIGRMLEQMRKLLPSHPRRMAYALAARTGTGHDAYQAWMNWKPSNTAE